MGVLVLIQGIELSPTHTPPTVSELLLDSTVILILPQTNPPSSPAPSPDLSQSFYPVSAQPPHSDVDPPRAFHEPASPGQVDPQTLLPATDPITPPLPIALTPPTSLLPPLSSTGDHQG